MSNVANKSKVTFGELEILNKFKVRFCDAIGWRCLWFLKGRSNVKSFIFHCCGIFWRYLKIKTIVYCCLSEKMSDINHWPQKGMHGTCKAATQWEICLIACLNYIHEASLYQQIRYQSMYLVATATYSTKGNKNKQTILANVHSKSF